MSPLLRLVVSIRTPDEHPAVSISEPPRPQWKLSGWVILSFLFLIGFVNVPLRTVGADFAFFPGDPVDARFNHYVLEHGYRYLLGEVPGFWDAAFFWPTPHVIAFSDAHLGMLPVYSLMRVCGMPKDRAFQGLFFVPFLLNYLACVWAFRRLGCSAVGTAMGSYLFSFGLIVTSQLAHIQLNPRFLVPVVVVIAWEALQAPTIRRVLIVVFGFVAQMYLTIYIAYFLGLLLLAGFLATMVWQPGRIAWREWLAFVKARFLTLAALLLLAGLLLVPLVRPYLLALAEKKYTPPESQLVFLAEPKSWITPSALSANWKWVRDEYTSLGDVAHLTEKQLFFGAVPLGFGLLATLTALIRIRTPSSRPVLIAVTTCVALGLLITQFPAFAAYEYVIKVPGISGIRAVCRLTQVMLFPVAFVMTVGVDFILAARRGTARGVRLAVMGLLVVALLSDQWMLSPRSTAEDLWIGHSFRYAETVEHENELVQAIRRHPNTTVFYVFPPEIEPGYATLRRQVDAMWASLLTGVPTINGFSGTSPPKWFPFRSDNELSLWRKRHPNAVMDTRNGLLLLGGTPH